MKNFILIMMLILSTHLKADELSISDSQCEGQENSIEQVIEAVTKTQLLVPIELVYSLRKKIDSGIEFGTASLSLTEIDNEIQYLTIEGSLSLANLGFVRAMSVRLSINQLSSGQPLRFANRGETPIVEVVPINFTGSGGQAILRIKTGESYAEIPLNVVRSNGQFQISSNGIPVNGLRILVGFDFNESVRQRDIKNAYVQDYLIR